MKPKENGFNRQHSLPNQLSYDVTNENYTKGIDVQQIAMSGKYTTDMASEYVMMGRPTFEWLETRIQMPDLDKKCGGPL